MISAGFILLHRKITEWEWYQNPNTFRVFLHCLLMANFTDARFEGQEVKRGQFVTSLPSLSKQTKLSIQQVRTALDHLKSTGEITDRIFPKFRIITVIKYNDYQQDNRQNNSQSTGNQQATNSQSTGNQQQYNNNNKETNNNDDCNTNNILQLSPSEVNRIIQEDQEIEAAALNVGLSVSASAMDRARDLCFRYGLPNLLEAIAASVDVPKWAYVEGVLRKMKQEQKEFEEDRPERENTMKQVLQKRGEWDEEYQLPMDKAAKFRDQGLSPAEAHEEMERERQRRIQRFDELAKQRAMG